MLNTFLLLYYVLFIINLLIDSLEGTDCHIVHGYVVHDNYSTTHVQLSYPKNVEKQIETGRSFHHGRFVMGLRKQAENETK